jgi:hypothetical protein
MFGRSLVMAAIAVACASAADAQVGPGTAGGTDEPRAEVGGALSLAGPFGLSPIPFGGPVVRVTVARDVAVEAAGDILVDHLASHFDSLYTVQVHQTVNSSSPLRPFVTYGATGLLSYERIAEYRSTSATGRTIVYAPHARFTARPPIYPTFGGGVRVPLTRAASLEAAGQAELWFPYGAILSGRLALVFPIGRRKS